MVEGEQVKKLKFDLTATSQEILPENPRRYYVLLVNGSDAIAYFSFDTPAVATEDAQLNASGGSYEINLTNPFHGRIYAVSAGVTKRLTVTEISY